MRPSIGSRIHQGEASHMLTKLKCSLLDVIIAHMKVYTPDFLMKVVLRWKEDRYLG